jgi:hypothetical protein
MDIGILVRRMLYNAILDQYYTGKLACGDAETIKSCQDDPRRHVNRHRQLPSVRLASSFLST